MKPFSNDRKAQVDNLPKNPQALLSRKVSELKSGNYYFMVLLALFSTFISYRFASGNQVEQLPMILRQLNPEFLSNDFFLSTTSQFGPRVYFVNLMSWVSEWLSLPWAYAVFTFLSNLALVMVTQWAARNVIGAGRLGTALACVMVLGLSSFHLGYGAPAKGNTLLNYCGINAQLLPYIVDKSPLKVGLYTPGMHIPVLLVETLLKKQPDYVLILAWNFAEEIVQQQQLYRERGGQFIVPLPEPRILG